ncbi:MAG: holo-ACP synthase [Alphaproteobacteria bacterium]|nr:holo-ACP synthase [Rhodospirillales bacterium]MCW9045882.1 holo-ACP synthase [Alphaproteobacteria bacterium]
MILGLGTDLSDIRRIEKTLDRFADRFVERICTPKEQEKAKRRRNTPAEYSKCFAAKEACAKALGTGFRKGVYWRDMELGNLPSGKPTMNLTGGAAKRLFELVPKGMEAQIDISLTDEYPLTHCIVIISAVPMT